MYYVPMADTNDTPENTTADAEVTGYGYLTEAETKAAIAAHEKAVRGNK